jgi:hypothetical protein
MMMEDNAAKGSSDLAFETLEARDPARIKHDGADRFCFARVLRAVFAPYPLPYVNLRLIALRRNGNPDLLGRAQHLRLTSTLLGLSLIWLKRPELRFWDAYVTVVSNFCASSTSM